MNDYEFETLLKRTFKQDCVSPFENRIDNLIGDMYSKKNKRKKTAGLRDRIRKSAAFALFCLKKARPARSRPLLRTDGRTVFLL